MAIASWRQSIRSLFPVGAEATVSRRRLSIGTPDDGEVKRARARMRACLELVSTERTYYYFLLVVMELFAIPLAPADKQAQLRASGLVATSEEWEAVLRRATASVAPDLSSPPSFGIGSPPGHATPAAASSTSTMVSPQFTVGSGTSVGTPAARTSVGFAAAPSTPASTRSGTPGQPRRSSFLRMFASREEDHGGGGAAAPSMRLEDWDVVFGALPPLINLHRLLLSKLEAAASGAEAGAKIVDLTVNTRPLESMWSDARCVGRVFVEVGAYLRMYSSIMNGHANAAAVWNKLAASSSALSAFVARQQAQPVASGQNLASMLVMPVQRIPRYQLLLTEILKHTPSSHPDNSALTQALQLVLAAAQHLNTSVARTEAQARVHELQRRIIGAPLLLAPHRHVVREGTLTKIGQQGKKNSHYFVLFNDLLMYCSPVSLLGGKLMFRTCIEVSGVAPGMAGRVPATAGLDDALCIQVSGTPKSFTLLCPDAATRTAWMNDLQAVAVSRRKSGELATRSAASPPPRGAAASARPPSLPPRPPSTAVPKPIIMTDSLAGSASTSPPDGAAATPQQAVGDEPAVPSLPSQIPQDLAQANESTPILKLAAPAGARATTPPLAPAGAATTDTGASASPETASESASRRDSVTTSAISTALMLGASNEDSDSDAEDTAAEQGLPEGQQIPQPWDLALMWQLTFDFLSSKDARFWGGAFAAVVTAAAVYYVFRSR